MDLNMICIKLAYIQSHLLTDVLYATQWYKMSWFPAKMYHSLPIGNTQHLKGGYRVAVSKSGVCNSKPKKNVAA